LISKAQATDRVLQRARKEAEDMVFEFVERTRR
jgi:hypothetical protein